MPFGWGLLLGCAAAFWAVDETSKESKAAWTPVVVKLQKVDGGFVLLRDGKPYQVKGAGGRSRLESLKAAGGNSIRTWHTGGMKKVLDEAHALGLSVTVGIWLGHERHGFDYRDRAQVQKQHDEALAAVRKLKDHPAVLMWGIGNEMEADGRHKRIWRAVNRLAKAIKEIDPHHPTMTVIAGTYNNKVREFVAHCPDIDVLGVNDYGDLRTIPARLEEQGLDRPYIVTEFGPYGWWQVEKASWGAEYEPTSTAKAETYLRSYQTAVLDQPKRCLGAFAFLWGHKQEHTHTWFGMFLPSGERTGSVDVMTKVWTGAWPDNRSPLLKRMWLEIDGKLAEGEQVLAKGSMLRGRVEGSDPDGDAIKVRWQLRQESSDKRSGGDKEKVPAVMSKAIQGSDGMQCDVKLPERPGPYRLFVYLTDDKGGAATANIPIMVK